MAPRARSALVLAAVAVAVVAGTSPAGSGSSAGERTTVTLVDGRPPIHALAQDGSRLAWVEDARPRVRCDWASATVLETTTIGSGVVRPLPWSGACTAGGYTLALAGEQVLWGDWLYGNFTYSNVTAVAVGARHDTPLAGESGLVAGRDPEDGDFLIETAGDGHLLSYSGYRATPVDYDGCVEGTSECRSTYTSWARRVAGSRGVVIPQARGGQIAVADPLVASVSYAGEPQPGLVDVRNAFTGAVRSSFPLRNIRTGEVRDLALTHRMVMLLIHHGSSVRIDVHALGSAALVRRISLRPRANVVISRISASDAAVVYANGTDLHAIDLRSFADRVVAHALPSPGQRLYLSIEGRRIIWSERSPDGGVRIRAAEIR